MRALPPKLCLSRHRGPGCPQRRLCQVWLNGSGAHSRRGCDYFLGGQAGVSRDEDHLIAETTLLRLLLLRDLLGHHHHAKLFLYPVPRPQVSGRNESGLEKRRQICAVPRGRLQSLRRKGKLSVSGEEAPNSIIHLLSTLITMETSWPMLIQSELALPRRVLSLGFLRQTSVGLWEQDLSCPLSPTHLW